MGLCGGKEIEYKDVMPEELQRLRKGVAEWLYPKIGYSATQLPQDFPLYAQTDPLTQMARSIMFGMGGWQNQVQPPWGTYNQAWYNPVGPGPGAAGVGVRGVEPGVTVTPMVAVTPAQTPAASPGAEPSPEATPKRVGPVGPAGPVTPSVDVQPTIRPTGPSQPVGPVSATVPGPVGPLTPGVGPVAIPGLQPGVEPSPYIPVVLAGPVGPVGPTGPIIPSPSIREIWGITIRPQPRVTR